mmetsp:Transcript_25912/g.54477  ORF Transcript_25912/g.54477 Transcript_25912/m.54477 type:complete len:130 (-) Transcript_25912:1401-1790(-)
MQHRPGDREIGHGLFPSPCVCVCFPRSSFSTRANKNPLATTVAGSERNPNGARLSLIHSWERDGNANPWVPHRCIRECMASANTNGVIERSRENTTKNDTGTTDPLGRIEAPRARRRFRSDWPPMRVPQ